MSEHENSSIGEEIDMTAKTKILVISRDPVMMRFFQRNLSDSDYQIASTQRAGEELKAVLDHELADLVILDVIMPSLDGIRECLCIRQWSQVPIMMLSTWGAGENRVRGLDLGADSYLTEPFGIDELMVRTKEALQQNFAAINLSSNIGSGVS